jgi:hypothetical protein
LPTPIKLTVNAGFDGSFRENQWVPVYIRISNDGDDVTGRLVVRPETSNNAVNNTFSVPIELQKGARKAVFLYITALSIANQIRVELINNDGVVLAAEPTNLRVVPPHDQLYVVVSGAASGSVDLSGVHDSGYSAAQANLTIDNLPDRALALTSVDMILFSDIDTGSLSTTQRQALKDWVAQGGHLIVTGGSNWQGTAAGLGDLLPFAPTGSVTLDDLNVLTDWTRFKDSDLKQQAVIATGTTKSDAQTLVSANSSQALLTRRLLGAGTVDYLSASPSDQPLRGWGGLTSLWLILSATVNPQPAWGYGVSNWEQATNAVNILPGVNLLPDILPLCGFLAIYIALVGPLNYLVLNRINRREYAWITIPIFILVFSVLAWVVGFNLRGNEVTVSRLAVIQSWPDSDRALTQEFIGLLSPRRAQYSLSSSSDSFLRPVPSGFRSNLLSNNVQTSTDIQQTDIFRAANFSVDASFIAGFNTSAFTPKPDIAGQATLFYDGLQGQQIMRGSVRNNTAFTLKDPVILVRGQSLRLEKSLAPGDVATFNLTLPGEGLPSPVPMAFAPSVYTQLYSSRSYSYQNSVSQTLRDILGDRSITAPQRYYYQQQFDDTPQGQEAYRRRLFLTSFINDPYNTLTGRGNRAYLAAWADGSPLELKLDGGSWKSLSTALYLAQIDVKFTPPTGEVLVSADQFTWTVRQRSGLSDIGPIDMSLQPGDEVVFQFAPLPNAVLKQVSELTVTVDKGTSGARTFPLDLWNWDGAKWETIQIDSGSAYPIDNPARFLGAQNAVQIRLDANNIGGYPRLNDLSIEQRGQF